MGAVCAGHITLTCLVATAIIDEETRTISKLGSRSTYTWLRDPDCSVVGALLADVQTEVRSTIRLNTDHVLFSLENCICRETAPLRAVYSCLGPRAISCSSQARRSLQDPWKL